MGRIRKRDLIGEFLRLLFVKPKKAAPRFELGIKDLQSSALPLGHAAGREIGISSADRISRCNKYLLVVCNGHGEDLIALRLLEALHELSPSLSLEVLPLVGQGKIFASAISQGWLKSVGSSRYLPSGGFSNQSFRGLVQDLSAGVLQLSWKNWRCVCRAASNGRIVLAVGDLLPLFFAWSSGTTFGFIGTPKSDYTWRSGPGEALSDYYHRLKGTEWDPWECALMKSPRCKMVAVRDNLTARGLRRYGVAADSPGNPMMDSLGNFPVPIALTNFRRLLLLCGSRMPEASRNFNRLLQAAGSMEFDLPLAIFVALGSEPTVQEIEAQLNDMGYTVCSANYDSVGAQSCWTRGAQLVLIGPGQFAKWASWAEVGLTNAGTATEQLVGLGIPAVSLPGEGPQFTKRFAFRQSRLLGGAVKPCQNSSVFAAQLQLLLNDELLRKQMGNIGARRMGAAGGSVLLASRVMKLLVDYSLRPS